MAVCTYTDIRGRHIYRKNVAAALICSLLGYLFGAAAGWFLGKEHFIAVFFGQAQGAGAAALSLFPGAFCLMASLLSREAIGYGDGLAVLVCGIALGAGAAAELLLTGLFFSAVWAVYLCIFRKAKRHSSFPFLPFLAAAFMLQTAQLLF